MNLIIDIGNTLAKYALFNEGEIIQSFSIRNTELQQLQDYAGENAEIKYVLLSSVVSNPIIDALINFLRKKFYFIELSASTPLPLENLYETPNTLGMDRLADAVGANHLFRNQNLLVIDAGTCIKYDFINENNQYLGGGISPGIEMRFKSLNAYTDKLPLISPQAFDKLIGKNTNASILSGVQNGVLAEVRGIINEYEINFPGLKTILTGGSMSFFDKHLKNSIFADPFLLLRGLNVILDYNCI